MNPKDLHEVANLAKMLAGMPPAALAGPKTYSLVVLNAEYEPKSTQIHLKIFVPTSGRIWRLHRSGGG